MTTIAYRRYLPEDRAAVLDVLAEGKDSATIAGREATFDWQFGGQSPHDDGRSPFWLVTEDGVVGGANGVMPVKIRYRGEPVLAIWSCETAVYLRHRGKGFGKGLLTRVTAEAEVVLGYGISDSCDPILGKLGWELSPHVRGLFFYAHEEGAKGLLKNARSSLVRLALGRPKDGAIEVVTREGQPFHDGAASGPKPRAPSELFGAEVDELWKASVSGYTSVVERDAAYLDWRYNRHPRLRYVAYHARRAGKLAGVLVARPDAVEAVIADYCGPVGAEDVKAALVDAAVSDLSRRGARRIRCETTDRALVDVLERAGFRETKSAFRFRVWSNRAGDRDRTEGFFVMTGDSDNDLAALGAG